MNGEYFSKYYWVEVRKSCPCDLVEHHTMIERRYGSTHSVIGTRWRWVVSFKSRLLYPQAKNPWYPLDRRLCGPQSRYGRCGEDKNSQPLPAHEPPIIQPTAQRYTTELSLLIIIIITPLPQYAFMAWYSVERKHRDKFIFNFLS